MSLVTRHPLLVPLRFALVVFDLDGTLIDSRADLTAAVNHVLGAHGLAPLSPEMVASYVGEGARLLVQRALGAAQSERFDDGVQQFMEYYRAHLLDHTRPYVGIPQVLTELIGRGATLAVLSNKPVAMSRVILDGLGLSSHFVAVLGGNSLPTRKPDTAGLEHVRALAGAPAERVLVVGDSLIDLRTATAAGVAFCGVTWGFAADALRAALPSGGVSECLIDHPSELLAVVAGSQAR